MSQPTAPILTLDLDGVIVRPPLGWNVAISRRLDVPPLPATVRRVDTSTRWRERYWLLRSGFEIARYSGRSPLPGVRGALAALAERRRLVVLSGRRWVVRPLVWRWLRRHGLAPYVAEVYLNDVHLPSAQYKLHTLQYLGATEHVDDDGATAYYLARHGGVTVYLCDWPRHRGLPYPPSVQVVRGLPDVARRLDAATGGSPE
jgi:phosphoglycolate phosphatase-like HAD superfamily hydrolase